MSGEKTVAFRTKQRNKAEEGARLIYIYLAAVFYRYIQRVVRYLGTYYMCIRLRGCEVESSLLKMQVRGDGQSQPAVVKDVFLVTFVVK